MAKIKYALYEDVGEWTSVCEGDRTTLTISLSPTKNGYISLGNAAYRVENGEVKIPLSELADDNYTPRLECDGGVYIFEGFRKCGNLISMLPATEKTIRSLLFRYRRIEEKIQNLDEELKVLKSKTDGHHIFN